jgi:hypothetical protein
LKYQPNTLTQTATEYGKETKRYNH